MLVTTLEAGSVKLEDLIAYSQECFPKKSSSAELRKTNFDIE
jgi:hypothetical protein